MDNVLTIKKLSKSFGNVEVLKSVNFSVKSGEIHGLVGANGSGKSTLLNILFGNPVIKNTGGYKGEVFLKGKKTIIQSTKEALSHGIGMIHQEFALISEMTVAENIKLGREQVFPFFEKILGRDFSYVHSKKNIKDAGIALNKLGIGVDPRALVKNLSLSLKQFVEIAREIDKYNLRLLLLDEPTAVLNKEDSKKLLEVLKNLAQQGTAVIFVSHRLEEITELCDRVTVLRDGEIAARYGKTEFLLEQIAEDMLGHQLSRTIRINNSSEKKPIMEFQGFSVNMPGERLEQLDLLVNEGEIIGITSLSGHGKLAVSSGVMGLYPTEGQIIVKGRELDNSCVSNVIDRGIYFVPEDRRNMGLLLKHSVMDNIIFTAMQMKNSFLFPLPFPKLSWPVKKQKIKYAQDCVEMFQIKCKNINQPVEELSGGNQQKVCIARALAIDPEILFIAEPTRGIDLGAKEIILEMLVSINKSKGTTIIIASSELDELKRICDRIVVLYEGKVSAILSAGTDDQHFALAFSGEGEDLR